MRVGVQAAFGAGDFHLLEQFQGTLAGGFATQAEVLAQHFFDLEAHGVAGVEGGHRVLEDHGQVLAHDVPALLALEPEHVVAVEAQAVCADDAGSVDQAHQRHHGHRLARA
ncbi:hypothetical protein D3C80_1348700 [compost metagenome]